MKYFKFDEFKCPCCGQAKMDERLLRKVDRAREIAGIPFIVTSGFRCEKHNAEVGGKPDSAHLTGKAVDVAYKNSRERFAIISSALEAGFNRIGIAENFIHLDVDETKSQMVCWLY